MPDSPPHGPQRLKVLVFSSLYPNAAMPNFGIFVENRLRQLLATGQVDARVVAPVPWFPSRHPRFGRYARWASVPAEEARHGILVRHPRYALPPKIGMLAHPFLMAVGALAEVRGLNFDFDVIDAHYYYPDGVAAILLGNWFNRPVVITARGTDLNVYPRQSAGVRRLMAWAARRASASIAVSKALADLLIGIGAPEERVIVLPNGVDLDLFRPLDHVPTRQSRDLRSHVILSVGNLIPLKGHDLVIEALRRLPEHRLLIVGEGPERGSLERMAEKLHVSSRVTLLGPLPHGRMPAVYGAADVLILASEREGWPNVLLEALACGTPVVATNVGGIPEIVSSHEAGRILPERSPAAIVGAVMALLADPPSRAAVRRHAEAFSWDATTQGQLRIFRSALVRQATC
ncbi:MAG: glycosyltransferase family 4 protein [Geminicoccaceae bacterium]